MPLSFAKCGEIATIQRISGKEEIRRHLANLGLIEGETVEVLAEINGDLILMVKDCRIAINRILANKISI